MVSTVLSLMALGSIWYYYWAEFLFYYEASPQICGGKASSVFPFPRPHSCGSLRHWVCPLYEVYISSISVLGCAMEYLLAARETFILLRFDVMALKSHCKTKPSLNKDFLIVQIFMYILRFKFLWFLTWRVIFKQSSDSSFVPKGTKNRDPN